MAESRRVSRGQKAADTAVNVRQGLAAVFRHRDGDELAAGQVWILWAVAGSGNARVQVPVERAEVTLLHPDGSENQETATDHQLTVDLPGDQKMAPPVIVLDRPPAPQ
jgi:hypothetical protein